GSIEGAQSHDHTMDWSAGRPIFKTRYLVLKIIFIRFSAIRAIRPTVNPNMNSFSMVGSPGIKWWMNSILWLKIPPETNNRARVPTTKRPLMTQGRAFTRTLPTLSEKLSYSGFIWIKRYP